MLLFCFLWLLLILPFFFVFFLFPFRDDLLDQAFIFDPESQSIVLDAGAPMSVRLSAVKSEFDLLKNRLIQESKKAKKSEMKLNTLTKGYAKRAESLIKSLGKLYMRRHLNLLERQHRRLQSGPAQELHCGKCLSSLTEC